MHWHDLSRNTLLAATVFAAGALAWHWLAHPPGLTALLPLGAIAAALAARWLAGRGRQR